MSFYSQTSRPPTKLSYTSASSNSIPRSGSARIVSSLSRSKDLLSVEEELKELLKNSNFNERQKRAFWEMLESTFDLFQAPLQKGSVNESLIDSSSLELYSKMQSLVTALSSLIMNEEEELANLEKSLLHSHIQGDDSTEFSDGEEYNNSFSQQQQHQHYQPQQRKNSIQIHERSFPKSASISNMRSISRGSPIVTQSRRNSIYFKNSPSFANQHSPLQQEAALSSNIRQKDKYRGLQEHEHLKSSFKVLQTPIPRSFSGRSERPKSMFVGKKELNQTPPLPMYSSPSRSNYDLYGSFNHHNQNNEQFRQEYAFETGNHYYDTTGGNDSRLTRRDSTVSTRSNRSKRYSMRF